jgi:hypothetical protein
MKTVVLALALLLAGGTIAPTYAGWMCNKNKEVVWVGKKQVFDPTRRSPIPFIKLPPAEFGQKCRGSSKRRTNTVRRLFFHHSLFSYSRE